MVRWHQHVAPLVALRGPPAAPFRRRAGSVEVGRYWPGSAGTSGITSIFSAANFVDHLAGYASPRATDAGTNWIHFTSMLSTATLGAIWTDRSGTVELAFPGPPAHDPANRTLLDYREPSFSKSKTTRPALALGRKTGRPRPRHSENLSLEEDLEGGVGPGSCHWSCRGAGSFSSFHLQAPSQALSSPP